ncbi:MAG: polysaccharide biosynthesis/export family protein [Gemmatimonadaceae bacterium]
MVPLTSMQAQRRESDSVLTTSAVHPSDELRPGDVVRLRIWREPDLSGDFMVDETGVTMLPKVGPVQVIGRSVDSLRADLLALYRRYVSQPSIEVTPLRRVRVTGAVRTPGLYTVDPTMTIADAIALAGGVTPQGRRDRITLVRGDLSLDLRDFGSERRTRYSLHSGDEVFVPQSSWLSRNPGVAIGAVSATASIIWGLRRR